MGTWRRVSRWVSENVVNLLTVAAFVMLGVGCWMAWPPLGLIVPASLVLALLIVNRWRGVL